MKKVSSKNSRAVAIKPTIREWVTAELQKKYGADFKGKSVECPASIVEMCARKLGVTTKSVRRIVSNIFLSDNQKCDFSEVAECDESIVEMLRNENSVLKRRVKDLSIVDGKAQAFTEDLKEYISAIKPVCSYFAAPARKTHVGSPVTATLLLSDWHIGEKVFPNEVENINQYDWAIAQKRVHLLTEKFINWVETSRQSMNIDEAVIVCLGDFISGSLHYELISTNEFPVPVQSVNAGYLLANAVNRISQHFKKVRVEFVVLDNHGRLTVKPQWKNGAINNMNYVVGAIAKERLREIKGVSFEIHQATQKLIEINGHSYLATHGHSIRAGGLFPWYGIGRHVAKEAKSRRMAPNRSFRKILLAHYHEPVWTTDFIANGSVTGQSEYGLSGSYNTDPSQTAFMVHPRNGEMNHIDFDLKTADSMEFDGKELVIES